MSDVPPLLLTADELQALTGYRQRTRQIQWLRETLRITPPLRCDGRPIVSRAQIERALAGGKAAAASGPRWSKMTP